MADDGLAAEADVGAVRGTGAGQRAATPAACPRQVTIGPEGRVIETFELPRKSVSFVKVTW